MPRFNIALLPDDMKWRDRFAALSQKHFLHLHDEYILGEAGIAHVTLCQFYADDEVTARDAYHSLKDYSPLELSITAFRIRSGTLVNSGKFIADLAIEKTEGLLQRQKKCAEHIAALGLKALTPIETYSPHITLARLSSQPAIEPMIDTASYGNPISFSPALGLSTEPGVFIRVLA